MQNKTLMMLAFVLMVVWGCKKDDEPVAVTGVVSGKVTDANTDAALEGVRMIVFESNSNSPIQSLATGADGSYKAELLAGSYYMKLYRNGYDQVPPKGMSPLPFTVSVGGEVAKPYEMNQSAVQNGGFISGKVTEAAAGVAGVLVVAQTADASYSAVTDAAGVFYIYNLPAASYTLKGWAAGYSSEQVSANVAASVETKQNLQLTKGAAGIVNGTLSFLATNERVVDIVLTHPQTREPIPGLIATSSKDFSIANVPAGTYIARASYQNDERVVDPNRIVKFGEPVVQVDNNTSTLTFHLTNSVLLNSPTNLPTTTEPIETSAMPNFSWTAYSSAKDYVVEVSDANGNVIWGGFSTGPVAGGGNGPVKNMTVTGTSVVFNADGKASSVLKPGKIYRWRVYASKDATVKLAGDTGWELISVSEDQMGLIRIAE